MPVIDVQEAKPQRSVAEAVQHYQLAQADYQKAVQRLNRSTAPRALDAIKATANSVAAARRAAELVRRAAAMRFDLPAVALELLGGIEGFDGLITEGVEAAKFAAEAARVASELAIAIIADDPLAVAGPRTREVYAQLSRAIEEELQRPTAQGCGAKGRAG